MIDLIFLLLLGVAAVFVKPDIVPSLIKDDDRRFVIAYTFTKKWEGGYVNDPHDLGGVTNLGVTQKTYNTWRKKKRLNAQSVRNITQAEAKQIFYENYWKLAGCHNLSDLRMAIVVFDTAINMGVSRAKTFLIQSGGSVSKYIELRKNKYIEFSKYGNQKKFLSGWLNRTNDLQNYIARV